MFPVAGAVLDRSAGAVGLMAAAIAVGGFVARGYAILTGANRDGVQRATIYGGFVGLITTILIILLDALAS